jgi:hypothetical protein
MNNLQLSDALTIGFANGVYNKLTSSDYLRFSQKYLMKFREGLANAIELHCVNEFLLDFVLINDIDLKDFEFVSLHAPVCKFNGNPRSDRIMKKICQVYEKYSLQNIVVHPDAVQDWDLLLKYSQLPISIENMDDNKSFGRTVDDISQILSKYDLGLTLDLQHCYVLDSSLELAKEFHKKFKKRIVEYHLSAYDPDKLHWAFIYTHQNEIIDSLEMPNKPVIIESDLDQMGDHREELRYIVKKLKNKI